MSADRHVINTSLYGEAVTVLDGGGISAGKNWQSSSTVWLTAAQISELIAALEAVRADMEERTNG